MRRYLMYNFLPCMLLSLRLASVCVVCCILIPEDVDAVNGRINPPELYLQHDFVD